MNDQDVLSRARKVIEVAVNAVLTTLDNDGYPQSRTMWTAGIDDDFTTYFVTGRALQKVKQVQANSKVSCFWTKVNGSTIGWDYVLLKGEASIADDQALRDRFWNEGLKEYFPAGKADPAYVIPVIKPRQLMLMDSHKYPLDKVDF